MLNLPKLSFFLSFRCVSNSISLKMANFHLADSKGLARGPGADRALVCGAVAQARRD